MSSWEGIAPSDEVVAARRRRELALAAPPLRRRDRLDLYGPNRHPSALPPVGYPNTESPSPAPARPVHSALLESDGPARSEEPWQLELVDPIQIGENGETQWGQVWRARAIRCDGVDACAVVLKLYDEALFRDPRGDTRPEDEAYSRFPASFLEEHEATMYSRARALQGRDIPLCYGFYTFNLRDNEQVAGVVLEDLTDHVHDLDEYARLMRKRNELDVSLIDRIACSAFEALARIQDCNMIWYASMKTKGVTILKAFEPDVITCGFLGFGRSTTRENSERIERKNGRLFRTLPLEQHDRVWLARDHHFMLIDFFHAFEDDSEEWFEAEKPQEKFQLVVCR
ncbi:hypothetical protein JCM10212_004845 [Sporobolomyces blumeae]